ncbi:hypothetical protein GCM10009647_065200 [Streptomyces sanglieri]
MLPQAVQVRGQVAGVVQGAPQLPQCESLAGFSGLLLGADTRGLYRILRRAPPHCWIMCS